MGHPCIYDYNYIKPEVTQVLHSVFAACVVFGTVAIGIGIVIAIGIGIGIGINMEINPIPLLS